MPIQHVIRNVEFLPSGGVVINYIDLTRDVKTNRLMISHALQVPAMPEYDEGLEAIEEAVRALLVDAIEDLSIVASVELDSEPEESQEDD